MEPLSREDIALARRIADLLEAQHKDHTSQRKLADDFVFKGYCGEIYFGRRMGIDFEFNDRPEGDGGIDYDIDISIQVKTVTLVGFKSMREAKPKRHLMVEAGTAKADIYALCGYLPIGRCALMGWENKITVLAQTPRVFPVVGQINNHIIQADKLRSIAELEMLIRRLHVS